MKTSERWSLLSGCCTTAAIVCGILARRAERREDDVWLEMDEWGTSESSSSQSSPQPPESSQTKPESSKPSPGNSD